MWSLLFCMTRTSILSRAIASRTAFQRRSSSGVEIGVFRRSEKAMVSCPQRFLPGCRFAHDIDHAFKVAAEIFAHIAFDRRHGAVLVAFRIAAEMRKDRQVFGLPQRACRG